MLFSLPLITITSNEPWNRNTKRIEIPQSQAMTLGVFHVVEIFGNFSLRKHPFLLALRRRAKRPQRRRARKNGCFRRLRKLRFGSKWKTFRRFFPLENSLKKWKIYKGRYVFRLERFERNSCSIYCINTFLVVSTSFNCYRLGSHLGVPSGNGLGAVPGFTIKWNKFLPIGKSIFVLTEFSGFLPKWKAPFWTRWSNTLFLTRLAWVSSDYFESLLLPQHEGVI